MSPEASPTTARKTGKVRRVLRDYGFLSCDDLPDQDIYFRTSSFRGSPLPREGEIVTFQLKTVGTNLQAHDLGRPAEPTVAGESRAARLARRPPTRYLLTDWAYLGYLPNTLAELKALALPEHWEFKDTPTNSEKPLPILYSYLIHTFGRLVLERKVLVNETESFAAFNTGLVDPRYEPIHALFVPNDDPRAAWQLAGFCIAGEGADGQNLVRHFAPLPGEAHYFDNPIDLLYDVRAGRPELDWRHVIIDRVERYPAEFIQDHWPPGFTKQDMTQLSEDQRKKYCVDLGHAIEADSRTYRRIMNRVKDAIDLSIKRVTWNFKTAIPTYYPRVQNLQLLLPVCLLSDDRVDLALAVEKTPSRSYLGHTVLSLDWAYKSARLVCRPDSDWLTPTEIQATSIEEEGMT